MTNVHSSHEEILVGDFCGAPIGTAPVNGAVLADDVVISNFNFGVSFWRERKILRRRPDDSAVSDKISVSDYDLAFDHDVRLHDGLIANCYPLPNDRKRPDLHIVADSCIRIDDSRGMDLRVRHISDLPIRISDFPAYNTPASLKLKYPGLPSNGAPTMM